MKTLLFYCPSMEGLAKKIAASDSNIELGNISWGHFPDGFPNLMIEEVGAIRGRNVVFLASFCEPAAIFEQLGVIYALPRYGAGSLSLVLPYLPTGTMERVDIGGQIATAKTLIRMISAIPPTRRSGPAEIVVFDIHALGEWFYFGDWVVPRLESAIPLLQKRLETETDLAIAFPDEGAYKRFGRMFEGYSLILCQKVKDGEQRTVAIKEGDPSAKHAVIVDDLVQSGGTLLKCGEALTKAGAKQVSAYATHGVFPQESWRKFTGEVFAHFWITDSCPKTVAAVTGQEPFEILSLDQSIVQIVVPNANREV